jgi:hypothetical protein
VIGTALRRAALLLALAMCSAQAHKPSDSYLRLSVDGATVTGQWDIALRDLDFEIGLDADGDGEITWGELRARHADIAAYAAARLRIAGDGADCKLGTGEQLVDNHTDGAYTVLPLRAECSAAPSELTLAYTLFASIDPQHRGLLRLDAQGATQTGVLGPQSPQQRFLLRQSSRWAQFADYVREGVWHIWIGFDHILFLLALLLPAVLVWRRPHWEAARSFGAAGWDVAKIVTAFTVAHSITLSLATLGLVSLPSRAVEATIAASVVLAALNNVFPLFHGRRWTVAFVFGLIHGFGFASVLADLQLPQGSLLLALVGFNIGVEIGQLAIVAVFLPIAYVLRRTAFYRRGVLVGGSLLIAAIAALWFAERAFNLELMPF